MRPTETPTISHGKILHEHLSGGNGEPPTTDDKDATPTKAELDEATQSNEKKRFLDTLRRFSALKVILAALSLFLIGGAIVYFTHERAAQNPLFYIFQEIGKGIIVTGLVSGAVKWYVTRQSVEFDQGIKELDEQKEQAFREESRKALSELRNEVTSQTDRMVASASSLASLQAAGIVRAFHNRQDAATDIRSALVKDDVTAIKLIGISLNDFVRDENSILHSAIRELERRIADGPRDGEGEESKPTLSIQVLLIDPKSNGAFLRANAEGKGVLAKPRLIEDVEYSIDYFKQLEKISRDGRVRLEVRLYRYAPMLHLVWTPDVCFVQQYYFCSSHSAAIKVPMFKCERYAGTEVQTFSAIDDLKFHFDWLWKHASISASEYWDNHLDGVDTAIREANVQNIYYDPGKSQKRILRLIEQTQKILYIKGVSLHSFFRHGPLFREIINACKRGVSVKVLLVDPNCEEARYRSFREYRILHKQATLAEFTESVQKNERLYSDTVASIQFIKKQRTLHDLNNLDARLYFSAAEAFCLLTDASVIVEQYHYGTISPDPYESSLGGDVPVIEYKNFTPEDEDIYLLAGRDKVKDPYLLFRDHFNFVFEHCSKGMDDITESVRTAVNSGLLS